MAVIREPIAKKCRSFDISPAVMGYGNKKSNRNPGGNRRRKVSEYGAQLKEKQKVKFVYGVQEKQFHKYYLKPVGAHILPNNGDDVKVGDVITLRPRSAESEMFKSLREGTTVLTPKWLSFDAPNLTGNVSALPARDDIDLQVAENMIVEYYSR